MDLATAQELKDAGYPQISQWSLRCPTLEEIIEALPNGIKEAKWEDGICKVESEDGSEAEDPSFIRAVALLWIEQQD